jgi:putative ABC transport system permease protein
MNDIRYAVRQLTKAPGFTVTAVLTLGLGIGACVAIFSVVNSVLLRPLPFPAPHRVVGFREISRSTSEEFRVTPGRYFAWQKQVQSFESMGAMAAATLDLAGHGEPVRLSAMRMTATVLPTFRVAPLLGRNFTAGEDVEGQDDVAILSHGLWQRQFGGRPDILDQAIQLSGRTVTIVGVMPRASLLPGSWDVFVPLAPDQRTLRNFKGGRVQVFARLKPGVTVAQAQNEMGVIAARFAQENPASRGWGVKVYPIMEMAVGHVRPLLLLLLGAVGFLLLIACANVANLLLARSTARAQEVAVRAALGASRGRLVRQLLMESVLLALLGGGLGVLIALFGLDGLLALAPDTLPRADEIAVDGRALAFTLALTLLTGVAFGLMPALQGSRLHLHDTLKERGRGTSDSRRRGRLRSALVVSEVAVAVILVAGAGLLMRSFSRLQNVNPGFRPEGVLAAKVALARPKYHSNDQYARFSAEITRLLAQLPGVQMVATTRSLPFTNQTGTTRPFAVAGSPHMPEEYLPLARRHSVSPSFFPAMGIPLLRGRLFDSHDDDSKPGVVIINDHLARKFFAGADPLGKRISMFPGTNDERAIVGVVGDLKLDSLEGESMPEIYQPFAVAPDNDMFFVLRTTSPIPGLPAAIRKAVSSVDADQPVAAIRPVTSWLDASLARRRFAMTLFAVFSGMALLLAAIGIYGVMAYSVAQRTAEIGIRMALGAHARDVMRLVLAQSGRLIALGVLTGVLGSLVLTRSLDRLLFGVSTHDPLTYVATIVLLTLAAAVACILPTVKATKVAPMTALRGE